MLVMHPQKLQVQVHWHRTERGKPTATGGENARYGHVWDREQEKNMATVTGFVEKIKFRNEDNG